MKFFELDPLDTLFFRDGRPFAAGESGQMEVEGNFPPPPPTVAGALRAELARSLGWDGSDEGWEAVKELLGSGEDLGRLEFFGPYLLKGEDMLLPAPLALVDDDKAAGAIYRLTPGDQIDSDLGSARFPSRKEQGKAEPLSKAWLTLAGMQEFLAGGLPKADRVIMSDQLYRRERRVGIRRDDQSRTTGEDSLYQTAHYRPQRGVKIAAGLSGWEGELGRLLTLGGESRLSWAEARAGLAMPEPVDLVPDPDGKVRYLIYLLTPTNVSGGRKPNEPLAEEVPGKVISACVDRPWLIGGWDSAANKPLPLQPYYRAGTVFFMEAQASDIEQIQGLHGHKIGARQPFGFGQILIGKWEDSWTA
jgi:CRISPR-associated protein Cmr3